MLKWRGPKLATGIWQKEKRAAWADFYLQRRPLDSKIAGTSKLRLIWEFLLDF